MVGPGLKNGLNIRIDDPGELGGDMVINSVAALAKYSKPIVIFDMETATTMSVIGRDGAYLGGALIPGIRVSVDAMSASAAQLPLYHTDPAGKTDLLQYSELYAVRRSLRLCRHGGRLVWRRRAGTGRGTHHCAHRPYAPLIAPYCRRKIHLDENLQLDGLRLLYEKNQPKRKKNKFEKLSLF